MVLFKKWLNRILLVRTTNMFRNKKNISQMVKEFVDVFPGRCMVCSYHRYGVSEGFLSSSSKPQDHFCIDEIIDNIRQACFHMTDEEAEPVIEEFTRKYPHLLDYVSRGWLLTNC